MNEHSIEHRLDQAIDALNNEASPAPYEQGDRELFSLVDTARLAKSLRQPAQPDADFPQLAIDRITADLRQSAPGNGIPPAATPTIGGHPMTTPDNTNPRGPIPFFRRHAQLAAIIVVLLLVSGGIYFYQSSLSGDDGSPAVGGPQLVEEFDLYRIREPEGNTSQIYPIDRETLNDAGSEFTIQFPQALSSDGSTLVRVEYAHEPVLGEELLSPDEITIIVENGFGGPERLRFHPTAPVGFVALSNDGSRMLAQSHLDLNSDEPPSWYVYDTNTGELLTTIQREDRLGNDTLYFSSDNTKLIRVWMAPADVETAPEPLLVVVYDLETGEEINRVELLDIPAASFNLDPNQVVVGAIHLVPGIAFSPDRSQMAIIHPISYQVTILSTDTLQATRTLSIGELTEQASEPPSGAGPAYQWELAFSADGRHLYAYIQSLGTLQDVAVNGLFLIDIEQEEITSRALQDINVSLVLPAPDGSNIYAITTEQIVPGTPGIQRIYRLDASTLEIEAEREFDDFNFLMIDPAPLDHEEPATNSTPDADDEPDSPAVTELRIDGMLCCGAVSGVVDGETYMFTLSQAGAMHIVHVDELGSIELVSSLEPPFSITPTTLAAHSRIAFADGMIYAPLPGDDTSGLWIVDVTDPADPVELALVETEMPPLSVAASNGVAAVAPMSFTGPLLIYDVSDPANAELVGEHNFSVASMPPAMEFDESLLYLTGRSGVVVIDLTDPDNPNDIGSFPNPDWEGPSTSGQTSTGMMDDSEFRDATLMDDHLVIAAANAGIRIIDVSDPSNLREVSQLVFDIPAFRVAATDTELYVLDTSIGSPGAAPMSEPHRIHTVDVSDIANPSISQSTLGPDGGMVQWLLTVNDNLYLLDYGIIRMFDGAAVDQDSSDNQPGVVATPDESGRCVAFNLADAQAMSAFPVVLPDDLPDGMELDAILLEHWAAVEPVEECEGADYVTAQFQVTAGAEQHAPIRFDQTTFESQFEGDEAQEVEVDGKDVTRYSSASADDATTYYSWSHDTISYVLVVPPQSPIAESALLQMIESVP